MRKVLKPQNELDGFLVEGVDLVQRIFAPKVPVLAKAEQYLEYGNSKALPRFPGLESTFFDVAQGERLILVIKRVF